MMLKLRLLARLSVAHFAQHRTRVVLTCLGIALGVGAVTAVLALSRSIVSTFQLSVVRGAGVAQLQVSNGTAGLDRELADALSDLPGVAATGATVQHHLSVPAIGQRLTVFGVELGRDEAYREVQTGPDVADIPDVITFIANTDSIAVSEALMAAQGWKRGDVIDVVGARGAQRLTIRGLVHPKGALGVYGDNVALMDLDAAQLRFGDPHRVHWIDIVVAPDAEVATVQAVVEQTMGGRGTVASPIARGRRIEAMLSLLRVLLTSTSVLAMFVGVFLIHHTLSTSYRQRRGDFVRLRSLGLSRWWLVAYLVSEAAILGLIGSGIGIAAGIGIWRVATHDFSGTISSLFVPMPTPRLALTAVEVGACLALGTLAVVVGALTPIAPMIRRRALAADENVATPPRAGWLAVPGVGLIMVSVLVAPLAHGADFAGQVAVVGAMGACLFLGATFLVPPLLALARPLLGSGSLDVWGLLSRWTLHQVWRQRLHTATTIGALSAGVALTVAFTVLLGSYRAAFHSWFDQTFVTGDVLVNAGPTISLLGGQTIGPELGAEIERLDGVAQVLRWRFLEVEYRGRPIVIQAMSEEVLERIYPQLAQSDGVIISDTLAEHFGVSVGDTLSLPAPVKEFGARVSGIVPDYVLHLGTVKIGWRTFAEHFGDERVSLLGVNVRPGVSPLELKAQIDALLGQRYDVAVLTAGEVRHLVEDLVNQSIALTYWLQLIAALVAVAAMVNATSASIIDRENELRTWRALGLLRWRLVRLLVGEAAMVGLIGSMLGLCAGALLGFLLTTEIARAAAGYRLTLVWPVATFIGVPVLCTLAAAGAAGSVAFRWTRGRALTNATVLLR